MPIIYEGRPILTSEEFYAKQAAGWFNPESSYDDYLAMIREQNELGREAQEKADREGYELGAPRMELTPEDEEILDRVWARLAAEKAAANAEKESALPARAT